MCTYILLREPLFGIVTPLTAVITRMCLHDLVNLNVSSMFCARYYLN